MANHTFQLLMSDKVAPREGVHRDGGTQAREHRRVIRDDMIVHL